MKKYIRVKDILPSLGMVTEFAGGVGVQKSVSLIPIAFNCNVSISIIKITQ